MPKHAKQQPSIPIFGSEEPLATVLAALEIEGNDVCFDCDRSVVGDEWLSAQHGTVHCIQCAGVHRSLGVHVSFVRSLLLSVDPARSFPLSLPHPLAKINELMNINGLN